MSLPSWILTLFSLAGVVVLLMIITGCGAPYEADFSQAMYIHQVDHVTATR